MDSEQDAKGLDLYGTSVMKWRVRVGAREGEPYGW